MCWYGAGPRNGRCIPTEANSSRCGGTTPTVRRAALGFSPLDKALGLVPGTALSPRLLQGLIRLGLALPFAEAATLMTYFTRVPVSPETTRRWTERAGAAQLASEQDAVERLESELPAAPQGPAIQLLSADGAMVPLVGGQWAEARLLTIGTVQPERRGSPRTTDLSYFVRLTDAETFGRLATVETHRRGTATAGTVVAVTDGAPWLQAFIDLHRPDAVRILDFPHAVQHLSLAAQAVYGSGTAAASEWLGQQAHRLRHGDPTDVLTAVADLTAEATTMEATASVTSCHAYLASRQSHLTYAAFADHGYPLGSGSVESGQKLVVQARLKGPGMHWTRVAVNDLLALRGIERSGRWSATWPEILAALRARPRNPRRRTPRGPAVIWPVICSLPALPAPTPVLALPIPHPAPPPKQVINGRPTAAHPWRRFRLPGSPDFLPRAK